MKCQSCGAEIGLLDKVCPHCGRENTESSGHQAKMKYYKKQSEKTKGKVKKSISENVPLVVSAIILVLLVIGLWVAIDVAENASLYSHRAKRREALKKYEEYKGELQRYLDEEDYAGFVAYKELHVIPEYEEEYKEFENVWNLAHAYNRAMNSIEQGKLFGPDARRYGTDAAISDCRSGIDSFYYEYDKMEDELMNDKYRDQMLDMRNKVEVAIRIYLGLEGEALRNYLDSSMNQKEAYLEGVMINE